MHAKLKLMILQISNVTWLYKLKIWNLINNLYSKQFIILLNIHNMVNILLQFNSNTQIKHAHHY